MPKLTPEEKKLLDAEDFTVEHLRGTTVITIKLPKASKIIPGLPYTPYINHTVGEADYEMYRESYLRDKKIALRIGKLMTEDQWFEYYQNDIYPNITGSDEEVKLRALPYTPFFDIYDDKEHDYESYLSMWKNDEKTNDQMPDVMTEGQWFEYYENHKYPLSDFKY